jgi:hypothetical protein
VFEKELTLTYLGLKDFIVVGGGGELYHVES